MTRDETCRACRTAQPTCSSRRTRQARLARHVFRGVATAWTGVDMSTSLFSEVVAEIDANTEHKTAKLVHVSTTASSSSTMLEPAWLDTLDTSYVSCRVETWRAKWNLGYCQSLRCWTVCSVNGLQRLFACRVTAHARTNRTSSLMRTIHKIQLMLASSKMAPFLMLCRLTVKNGLS